MSAVNDASGTETAEGRSTIEQAKGMLMLVYRIDAEAAFDLLTWRSQACGVELGTIAEQIIVDFLGLHYQDVLPTRTTYDELLLTAQDRVVADD